MEQRRGGGGQPCRLGSGAPGAAALPPFYSSQVPVGRLFCSPAVSSERDLSWSYSVPLSLSGSCPLSHPKGSLDLAFGGDCFVVKDTFQPWNAGCTCAQHRGPREAPSLLFGGQFPDTQQEGGLPCQPGLLFCVHSWALIAPFSQLGDASLVCRVCACGLWGYSLPAPPPECVACTLPHLGVTYALRPPISGLMSLSPHVLHGTIHSRLECPTNILCPGSVPMTSSLVTY